MCGNLVYKIKPQYFPARNTSTLSNYCSLFSYQLFEMVLPWHLFFQIVRHVEKTFKDTNTDVYIFGGHYKGQVNLWSGEDLSSLKLHVNENWPKGWSKSCWFDPAVQHYSFPTLFTCWHTSLQLETHSQNDWSVNYKNKINRF